MICTSYYANINKILDSSNKRCVLLAVSQSRPNIANLIHIKGAAPHWSLVDSYKRGDTSKELYTEMYKNFLNNLDISKPEFFESLKRDETNENYDVILLCYEKPKEFCHRHILAEWLNEQYHMNIKEWEE